MTKFPYSRVIINMSIYVIYHQVNRNLKAKMINIKPHLAWPIKFTCLN
mgnify:CR=1 FL=1